RRWEMLLLSWYHHWLQPLLAQLYVDNGWNAMGVGVDSPVFKDLDIPRDNKH
ncbi:hypothetical protein Tco_0366542, partial [Tanacetum coccineum]